MDVLGLDDRNDASEDNKKLFVTDNLSDKGSIGGETKIRDNRRGKDTLKTDIPARDAFLTNPVASVHDCTGYTPYGLINEEDAENRAAITDAPTTSADGGEGLPPIL